MSIPEPFSPEEREYYAGIKDLLRERLPGGRQVLAGLRTAFENYFKSEGIILSRRERYRLFQLILEEILEEVRAEFSQTQP
jgi:hypothetical protein